MRKFPLLVVLLGVAVLLATLPVSAQTTAISVRLRPVGSKSKPQGRPFAFKAIVTNDGTEAAQVSVSFDVTPADSSGFGVAFDRWSGSLPPGGRVAVNRNVVTSQWFAPVGMYRVSVRAEGVTSNTLHFEVTKAPRLVPRFRDRTSALGLEDDHPPRPDCDGWSSGAAWGDVDGDQDLDLYVPQQEAPSSLWINDGGSFTQGAGEAGLLNTSGRGISAVFVDYDNDADQDLYVVNFENSILFRNDGTGHFEDVTAEAGVPALKGASSASWADYDNDGFLDLYVPTWADCSGPNINMGPLVYQEDVLYHNEGDGTFTDQTDLLRRTGSTLGAGFQAAWFDYDSDGDVDLYLGNDYYGATPRPNVLWRNDGPGENGEWVFENVSEASGTGVAINTMGIGIADYDHDLDFDMALSNISSKKLFQNNGDGTFTDVARRLGIARPFQRARDVAITWGLAFHDFNNDTWEDLYVAAGPIRERDLRPNEMWVSDGAGRRFLDLSAPSRTADSGPTRGVAFADFDRDGRMDIYAVNEEGFARLYRNRTPKRDMHWLEVQLVGVTSARDACGARLIATLGDGTKLLRHRFCGSVSLGSGHDPAVHFGLGPKKKVRKLEVLWPSGAHQVLRDIAADRLITVTEEGS